MNQALVLSHLRSGIHIVLRYWCSADMSGPIAFCSVADIDELQHR